MATHPIATQTSDSLQEPASLKEWSPMTENRPIFVVGYMHTGTSLIRKILGLHSEVYAIRAETNFFEQLPYLFAKKFPDINDSATFSEYVNYLLRFTKFDWPPFTKGEAGSEKTTPELTIEQEREVLAAVQPYRDYTQAFFAVFGTIAKMAEKRYWLEKTPRHIYYVDTILREFPNARIIEAVRDPRDILSSRKIRKETDWALRYGEGAAEKIQVGLGYDPLRDSSGWKAAIKSGNDALLLDKERFLRVRYEDLVTSPEEEVLRICRFLGLTFEESMMQVGWSNTTVLDGSKNIQGIKPLAVNKWQGKLPLSVVALCQQICRIEMEQLGYELAPVSLLNKLQMPYWVIRSGFDALGRLAKAFRHRGLLYVQGMVINSLKRFVFLKKNH